MSDFAIKHDDEDQTSVYFNIEADEVIIVGQQMEAINEKAYMNGYNWEVFFNYYLKTNNPELLEGLDTDPEAGTYAAFYGKPDYGKAEKFVGIINGLLKSPDKIYDFLKANGEDIEWD